MQSFLSGLRWHAIGAAASTSMSARMEQKVIAVIMCAGFEGQGGWKE